MKTTAYLVNVSSLAHLKIMLRFVSNVARSHKILCKTGTFIYLFIYLFLFILSLFVVDKFYFNLKLD